MKVWDASEDFEYIALATFGDGYSDTWGDIYTVIAELDADAVYQDIALDGVILNNISLNIQPEDADIANILSNLDVIIAANDEGDYYIPNNDVNTFGDWENGKGVQLLIDGFDDEALSVFGFSIDPYTSITLNPLMLNNIAYLLDVPTSVEGVFSDLDSPLFESMLVPFGSNPGPYFLKWIDERTIMSHVH